MGRPSKKSRTLSKDEVLKRALRLLDTEGREALTFRALARAFDVTPMAIAHHVGTREAMLSSLITEVYKGVGQVPNERPPVETLRFVLSHYCDCVLKHPELAKCILENPSLISPQLIDLTALIKEQVSQLVDNSKEVDMILNLIIDYTHGFALSVAEASKGKGVGGPSKKEYLMSLDWILNHIAQ